MAKHIVTTVQTIVRKYYAEVDDPTWAHDSIVMNELSEFSQYHSIEDIIDTQTVVEWPKADSEYTVNGSTSVFDYAKDDWVEAVRWDLAK